MSGLQWNRLAEVQPAPVHWFWEGRVPFGKVTLLDGEPGSGKSLLALDLAARASRGALMPFSRNKAANPAADVVIFNDEDNLADTIRPRLDAAAADLTRVRSFDGLITVADAQDVHPALIILDPLSDYIGKGSDIPPRQIIRGISRLAKESGAAILVVQSAPKTCPWGNEILDVARSVLHITTIGHGRHRIALTKSNLCAVADVPPLLYHLEPVEHSVRLVGWADSV